MRLIKGEDVFSANGEKLGNLDRVIIDPKTKEVTHLVIEKGFLFTTNKVVPIEDVNSQGDRITLTGTDQKLEALEDFEETHYVALDESEFPTAEAQAAQASYWYPPLNSTGWRVDMPSGRIPAMPGKGYIKETKQNIPEGSVALEEGAKVVSVNGKHVGNIEQVVVDTNTSEVTHFVVSEGGLFHDRKLVPVLWIDEITENEVKLSVGSSVLERLPEYKLEVK